jgi:hypothetical protein
MDTVHGFVGFQIGIQAEGEARPQAPECQREMRLRLADVAGQDQPIVRRCPDAGEKLPVHGVTEMEVADGKKSHAQLR